MIPARARRAEKGSKPRARPRSGAAQDKYEAILRLHAHSGNRAVSKRLEAAGGLSSGTTVVQRYVQIDPAVYSKDVKAEFPSRIEGRVGYERKRQTLSTATPTLNYSASADPSAKLAMAVERTVGEPKAFYATKEVRDDSNQKLEGAGSKVRLVPVGGSIKVPHDLVAPDPDKQHDLQMVKHGVPEGGGVRLTEMIADQAKNECNSVVGEILGAATVGSRVAVLSGGQEVLAPSENEPTHEIAEFAATRSGDASELASQLKPGKQSRGNEPLPQSFLDMPSSERSERGRELGFNEGAVPEVGEGYVITSHKGGPPEDDEQTLAVDEYLDAIQKLDEVDDKTIHENGSRNVLKRFMSWGYHYAGVVARVGSDTVTLENFNRLQAYKWQIDQMYNELFKAEETFRDFVKVRVAEEKAEIPTVLGTRVGKWRSWARLWLEHSKQLADTKGEAERRVDEAIGKIEASLKDLLQSWNELSYFRMYGTDAGQSFHEQWGDVTANPLTLRVRESVALGKADATNSVNWVKTEFVNLINRVRVGTGSNLLTVEEAEIVRITSETVQAIADAPSLETALKALADAKPSFETQRAEIRKALVTKAAAVAGKSKFTVPGTTDGCAQLIEAWLDEWAVENESFFWWPSNKKRAPGVRTELGLLAKETKNSNFYLGL